jgi:hypothetical protein
MVPGTRHSKPQLTWYCVAPLSSSAKQQLRLEGIQVIKTPDSQEEERVIVDTENSLSWHTIQPMLAVSG